MSTTIAALDVGGTSIKSGVVVLSGRAPDVSSSAKLGPALPTLAQATDAETILGRLAEMADHALGLSSDAAGLAIAICGPFDIDAGVSLMRGVHKFEPIYGIDLRSELRRRTTIGDRPVRFARDAESAGVGEALAGAGTGFERMMILTVGTGLGTCVTSHGSPVPTIGGFGVEHTAMRETPWGRADDVLSARGLADRLGIAMHELPAAVSDPANAAVVTDHGARIGAFAAPLVDEYRVDVVVIGGAIAAAFERFGPAIQAELGDTPVRAAALGPAGPLIGAAHLTFA